MQQNLRLQCYYCCTHQGADYTEAPLLASKFIIRASVPVREVLTCHLRLRVNEGDVLLRRQVNVLLRQRVNEDDEKEGVPVTLQK